MMVVFMVYSSVLFVLVFGVMVLSCEVVTMFDSVVIVE